MFRALWFFIQIAGLTAGAIWLSQRDGRVVIDVLNYTLHMQTGVFLVTLLALILISIFIYRFVRAVFSIPGVIGSVRQKERSARGFQSLTRGLVAVAAGDAKRATQYAKQTRNLLPKQNGLPVLLDAQAARMRGEEGVAKIRFQELMKDKDAAFLGVRGLLTASIDQGDMVSALRYAKEAAKHHPKQGWVMKTLYNLQVKNKKWDEALDTLKKCEKYSAISAQQAASDRVAIYHVHRQVAQSSGDEKSALKALEKAYKIDPTFVPTTTALIQHCINAKKKRRALNVFKKVWSANPHPDLLALWDDLAPKSKRKAEEKRMKWYEELVSLNADSALGYMGAAKAAMDLELWSAAKSYLITAEKLEPSSALYKQMALVEQNLEEDESILGECMDKAASAPPNKVWVCRDTGIVYEEWEPVAEPHGSFNSIEWDYPYAVGQVSPSLAANDSVLMIDPVRA